MSRRAVDRKWIEKDDRPWRDGKITIYTGESHVWAHPNELILMLLGV